MTEFQETTGLPKSKSVIIQSVSKATAGCTLIPTQDIKDWRKQSDGQILALLPMRDRSDYRYSMSSTGEGHNPFVDISSQCVQAVTANRLSKFLTRSESEKHRSHNVSFACPTQLFNTLSRGSVDRAKECYVDMNGPRGMPKQSIRNGPSSIGEGHTVPLPKDSARSVKGVSRFAPSSTENNNNNRRRSTIFMSPKQRLTSMREKRIKISMDKSGKRLGLRKKLYGKRVLLSDASLTFAVAGIVLMLIDNELAAADVYLKISIPSIVLRYAILCTTLVLHALIIGYHACEVQVLSANYILSSLATYAYVSKLDFVSTNGKPSSTDLDHIQNLTYVPTTQLVMIDSGTDDWRVAISASRVMQILLELLVCSACPLPWTGTVSMLFFTSTRELQCSTARADVPTDLLLAIPMLLRSYLIARAMVVHSHIFRDTATRTIAALNRISVDFKFVLKTLMTEEPIVVLVVFTLSFWLTMSWVFTQCERYNPELYRNETMSSRSTHMYLDSLWLVVITFMSIGYGDVVPHTVCGRAVSICSGIMGVGVASALVAVIARKLELTKAERHVNVFLAETKALQRRKHAAAAVLQHMWFVYKSRKCQSETDEMKHRYHQRNFLNAINEFRRAKWDHNKANEQNRQLVDIVAVQKQLQEMTLSMLQNQTSMLAHLREMQARLDALAAVSRYGRRSSCDSMQYTPRFRTSPRLKNAVDIEHSSSYTCETQLSDDVIPECCANTE